MGIGETSEILFTGKGGGHLPGLRSSLTLVSEAARATNHHE
jgi:hypothetical protein